MTQIFAQRKLDANLLKQFQNDRFFIQFVQKENQKDFFLSKIEELPELMQEIKFKPNKPKIEMLIKSLEINGFLEDKEHIDKVVDELQRIIGGWSGEARLQAINANFIKYQNERVEPICLLPEGFDLQKIFGTFNCDLNKRTLCQDASLFCAFCNNLNTLSIQKDEKDQFLSVPILKIAFMAQYKFELIKRNERMKELNQALLKATKNESIGIAEEIEKLKIIDKLLAESCEKASLDREKVTGMKAMVAVLSTYGSDMRILHLILSGKQSQNQIIGEAKNSKKLRTFLQALAYLEQWAINNHIYSTEMEGYLDSKILRVMLAKVFLSFPNASRPFLIEQFFWTFSTWNWPLPVQLQMIDYDRSGGFLIWSPGRQWMQRLNSTSKILRKRLRKALTIPIISPMFPEQNLGQKINLLTAKVIQCKLREALTQLWNEKNACAEIELLKGTKFTDLYEEFVAISCAGPQFIIEKFCDFVGQRFGHELVDFKEEFLGDLVEYLHLYPTILNMKFNNMPPNTLNTTKEEKPKHNSEQLWQNPHEKLWIFGIRLNKGLNESLRSKLNENLRTNFDVRIVRDFQAEFFFCKVQLHSKFVSQRELLNLVIL
uniref:polynucleotide adenylyltransferase n=1 Tax=Globodera rostochiensis TaxID=31243 RepID=A0A914H4L0_GLORO